jgi:hypothetical protein
VCDDVFAKGVHLVVIASRWTSLEGSESPSRIAITRFHLFLLTITLIAISNLSSQEPSSCPNSEMAVQTKTATFAAVSSFFNLQPKVHGMPSICSPKLNWMLTMQGCFWGVEHYINKKFKTAIKESKVGYSGGKVQNPSYQAVRPPGFSTFDGQLSFFCEPYVQRKLDGQPKHYHVV